MQMNTRAVVPSLLLLLAGSSIAQTPSGRAARPLAEFSAAIVELAHGASASVVQLTVQRRAPVSDDNSQHIGYVASQQATGSGVVVDRDGYIVTNAHVVDGARHIDVSVLNAAVGDDILRDDPTVIELEELSAGMFGKEAALLTISGTMNTARESWSGSTAKQTWLSSRSKAPRCLLSPSGTPTP